jgi:hypothetical protein
VSVLPGLAVWRLRAGEAAMPFIVVTRLRLRDSAFFDEFFASAVAVVEQATNSEGNLGADVLAEAKQYLLDPHGLEGARLDGRVRGERTAPWAAWMSGVMRRHSLTGSKLARVCRTGRKATDTSSPTARWPV